MVISPQRSRLTPPVRRHIPSPQQTRAEAAIPARTEKLRMSEDKIEEEAPSNLDQLDFANGLATSPGPPQEPPSRAAEAVLRRMQDADLLAAIQERPTNLRLLDEQARRDGERVLLWAEPDRLAKWLSAIPQEVLELLAQHTLLGFYRRELSRRSEQPTKAVLP